jgi:hypothetical protein
MNWMLLVQAACTFCFRYVKMVVNDRNITQRLSGFALIVESLGLNNERVNLVLDHEAKVGA